MPDPTPAAAPATADQLRTYVHSRLCAMEGLLEDQFETDATPLVRGGRPCGVQYFLQGPRSVRLGAVWASDRNELFVYDAQGRRADKIALPRRIA